MKRFFLNRASSLLMASLVMAGALMAQPVFALLTGTATSTGNTVTAVGADITLSDDNEPFPDSALTASLTAQFTASPQVIYAGYIDVRNPAANDTPWAPGYDLANVANPAAVGAANILLDAQLRVRIETVAVSGACESATLPLATNGLVFNNTGGTGTGGNSLVAVESIAWAGTLFTNRATLNTTSGSDKTERLCFYLLLPTGNDGAAGASLTYALTFTAN